MNIQALGELIRLRYKLMWAKTRSRNGRIALFFAGYLLLVLVLALLAAGGFSAGLIAVRSGKSELVARIVFSSLFLQAIIASISLGFGVDTVFSELELRRFPVTARERFLVRHTVGLLDPFWALFLLLELGLVVGLYVFGGAPIVSGLIAVVLLFLCNYGVARLTMAIINRMIAGKAGSLLLLIFIVGFGILPGALAPVVKQNPKIGESIVRVLGWTAPFGAAAAATRTGVPGMEGLALLAVWLMVLAGALIAMERLPISPRRATAVKVNWQDRYDRAAALLTRSDAPFVAHWLRFYLRNSRFRTMYLLTFPLMGFLIFNFSRTGGGTAALFPAAFGIFAIAGFFPSARTAVNLFGYTGGGFRRFFLLPTDPAASLRAGVYASMLLGGTMVPLLTLGWILLAPVKFDPRAVFMLLASGVTGLFVFHGLGLWVSMLNPRKGNYYSNFGNDLSLGGNIVLIGGMLVCLFVPQILRKFAPSLIAPAHWWFTVLLVISGAAFFKISLRGAGELFRQRRERLLAVVEGRD